MMAADGPFVHWTRYLWVDGAVKERATLVLRGAATPPERRMWNGLMTERVAFDTDRHIVAYALAHTMDIRSTVGLIRAVHGDHHADAETEAR